MRFRGKSNCYLNVNTGNIYNVKWFIRIVILIIIFLFFLSPISFSLNNILEEEKEKFGISNFLEESDKYIKNNFEDLDSKNIFSDLIKGKVSNSLFKTKILQILSNELLEGSVIIIDILIVIIIHSILNSIISDLGSSNVSKIAYFLQYILIATLIIKATKNIIDLTVESIQNLTNYMNILIPILSTLSITTGNVTTVAIVQPVLLLIIAVSANFIKNFIIPILICTITLSIISNLSDKVQVGKLANFFKSTIVWIIGIVITIFVGVLSIEGTLSSSVDGLTAKTTKAAVSTVIPVVGKVLGDSVDAVIGSLNILKNAVGVIGILIIVGIVIIPILKVLILWFYFKLTTAISEIIADKKITSLIEQISDGYKILLGVLSSVSVMFIIGITLLLKITNSSLMYR